MLRGLAPGSRFGIGLRAGAMGRRCKQIGGRVRCLREGIDDGRNGLLDKI
jgi:hypothetical protein